MSELALFSSQVIISVRNMSEQRRIQVIKSEGEGVRVTWPHKVFQWKDFKITATDGMIYNLTPRNDVCTYRQQADPLFVMPPHIDLAMKHLPSPSECMKHILRRWWWFYKSQILHPVRSSSHIAGCCSNHFECTTYLTRPINYYNSSQQCCLALCVQYLPAALLLLLFTSICLNPCLQLGGITVNVGANPETSSDSCHVGWLFKSESNVPNRSRTGVRRDPNREAV